jgi:hypothetical protein
MEPKASIALGNRKKNSLLYTALANGNVAAAVDREDQCCEIL